jgi:hypothetical protein
MIAELGCLTPYMPRFCELLSTAELHVRRGLRVRRARVGLLLFDLQPGGDREEQDPLLGQPADLRHERLEPRRVSGRLTSRAVGCLDQGPRAERADRDVER